MAKVSQYETEDGKVPFKRWFSSLGSKAALKVRTAVVVRGLGGSHFRGPLGARCCGFSGTVWRDLRVAGFAFDVSKS